MCIEFAFKKAGIPIIRNFLHSTEGVVQYDSKFNNNSCQMLNQMLLNSHLVTISQPNAIYLGNIFAQMMKSYQKYSLKFFKNKNILKHDNESEIKNDYGLPQRVQRNLAITYTLKNYKDGKAVSQKTIKTLQEAFPSKGDTK
ncbi:hypothetical protein ABPG72_007964 [Tetrahymena utriculariae]